MVVHAGQKDKRVMIREDYHRQRTGPDIDFKVLECQQQSKGFFFSSRVFDLVLAELKGNVRHRVVNPISKEPR